MKDISEKDLIQLILNEPDNYRHIVDRYEEPLLRYIKRFLYVNSEDAQDIVQDVFIKAYRNLNSYNPRHKFSSWIYRIAHNEAVSFLRKNRKRKVEMVNDRENSVFENLASDLNIEEEYIKKDFFKKFKKALYSLDSKYRDVLVLKFMEEKDYNEISEILHIPSGTIGSLISRAKDKLRSIMGIYEKD